MLRRSKYKIDFFIIFLYLLLVALGLTAIYIADFHADNIGTRHRNQQIWIGISFMVAILILLLNKRLIIDFSYHYYIFLMLTLAVVLVIGTEINGAKAWFQFGSIRIQPAEFAKFTTCLALAKYVGQQDTTFHNIKHLLTSSFIILIPLSFVILQNDMGSALVYCSFLIPLYREGLSPIPFITGLGILVITISTIKWGSAIVLLIIFILTFIYILQFVKKNKTKIFLLFLPVGLYFFLLNNNYDDNTALLYASLSYIGVLFAFLFIPFNKAITQQTIRKIVLFLITNSVIAMSLSVSFLFEKLLKTHQKERILQVIGEAQESYNVMHAKIAIALGGFSGQGFLQGTHTKLSYVPEQETDFIFTTIGETYGFIGSSLVILLFLVFMLRLIHIAERQTARFSRIYAYGVISIFFFHFLVNIGMVIGLLPVIGIPLPFFSYGGSSLLAFTILLFILIKLDISREDRVI